MRSLSEASLSRCTTEEDAAVERFSAEFERAYELVNSQRLAVIDPSRVR